jgi:hypothetical protein
MAELDIVVRTQEAADAVRRLREEMQQLGFQAKDTAGKTETSLASPSLLGRIKALDGQFGALKATLAGFAGLAVVGTISSIARAAIDAGRELDSLATRADRLGISIETLQELEFAGTLEDVDPEQLTLGLQRLSIAIDEAAQGEKEAAETFRELGVSVRDVNGNLRPTEGVLRDVADALEETADPARRLALGAELFTARGLGMLNVLRGGSAGLDEFARKARDTGAVIDENLVRRAGDTADEFDTAAKVIDLQFKSAIVEALPAITLMTGALADMAKWIGEVVDGFRDIENQSTTNLRTRADEIREQLGRFEAGQLRPREAIDPGASRAELRQIENTLIGRELDRRFPQDPSAFGGGVAGPVIDVAAAEREAKAAEELAERQAELNTQIEREVELLRADDQLTRELIEAKHRFADAQEVAQGNTELLANAAERLRLEEEAAFAGAAERAAEKRNELLEEGRRLYEAILTPLEVYQRTLAEIAELEAQGGLSPDQAGRLRDRAAEDSAESIIADTDRRSRPETTEDVLLARAANEYAEAIERVTQALREQRITQEEANAQLDTAADRYLELKDAAREAQEEEERFREALDRTQDALSGGLQQVFTDLITGSKDAGDAFKEFAARAVAAVLELIFQMTALKALQDSLGGGGGGSGASFGVTFLKGFLGGLFGGGTGIQAGGYGSGSGLFGGAAAEGGLVLPRPGGVPVLTAEAGSAELLLPLQDPRAMRMLRDSLGGSGAGAITVNITNQGAPLAVDSTRTRQTERGVELDVAVRNYMLDEMDRGGPVARSMGRRFRAQPPRSQV